MIRFAFRYIGKYKLKYSIYVLEVVATSIIGVAIPVLSGMIIDIVTKQKVVVELIQICIVWGILESFKIMLEYLSNKAYTFLETNGSYEINKKVLKHLHKVSLKYFDNQDMVYLSARIYNDSNSIITFSINIITNILSNGIFLILSIAVIWHIEKHIGIFLIVLLAVYSVIYILYNEHLFKMSFINKENQEQFFSSLIEQLNNVRFVKQHELSDKLIGNLDKKYTGFFRNIMKTQKFFYFYDSLDSMITSIGKIAIYLFGGVSVMMGTTTIGAFIIILNYFENILSSVKYFTELAKKSKDSQVAFKRLQELLQLNEKKVGKTIINNIAQIKCSNMLFNRDKDVIINQFTHIFSKGKIYCLWGENGSGKSTMIDLLIGIYTGEFGGKISYNGVDIHDINMINAREQKISIIEQEPHLFYGNIKENLLLTANHNEDKLDSIIKLLGFNDIEQMIKRNKQIIDDKRSLSGGEKQKIALLRIFLKSSASVFILDEPTSALDEASKKNLMKYIKLISSEKITIIISHDKTIAESCDEIVRL